MKTFTIDEKNKFIDRIINPTKIIAVGLNYHDHAQEMKKKPPKEPMIFLKSPSSLTGHIMRFSFQTT